LREVLGCWPTIGDWETRAPASRRVSFLLDLGARASCAFVFSSDSFRCGRMVRLTEVSNLEGTEISVQGTLEQFV
jgi:hypothetical protein